MLTLTITDPHLLNTEEKTAVLAFLQIKVDTRAPERLAGAPDAATSTTKNRKPAAVVPITPAGQVEVIKPEDNPATGVDSLTTGSGSASPPAGVIDLSNVAARDTAGTGEAADTRTAAEAFGSVPNPPSPTVAGVQAILANPAATIPSPGPATQPASTTPSPDAGSTGAQAVPSTGSATPAASGPAAGASDAPPPGAAAGGAAPPAPSNALDSRGMPWDHRIHSGTKAKIAGGVWRQKRGVDPALIASIEEQLKKLIAIPAAGTANGAVIPAPDGAAPAAAIPAPGGMTFEQLMLWIIPLTTSDPPKITQPMLLAAIGPLGLLGLPDLRVRPDLIPQALAAIKATAGVQ